MKLKCEECGAIFDDDELATWEEPRGEFWGQPCFQTMSGCPFCYGGAVIEYNGDDDDDDEERNENG